MEHRILSKIDQALAPHGFKVGGGGGVSHGSVGGGIDSRVLGELLSKISWQVDHSDQERARLLRALEQKEERIQTWFQRIEQITAQLVAANAAPHPNPNPAGNSSLNANRGSCAKTPPLSAPPGNATTQWLRSASPVSVGPTSSAGFSASPSKHGRSYGWSTAGKQEGGSRDRGGGSKGGGWDGREEPFYTQQSGGEAGAQPPTPTRDRDRWKGASSRSLPQLGNGKPRTAVVPGFSARDNAGSGLTRDDWASRAGVSTAWVCHGVLMWWWCLRVTAFVCCA